MVGQRRLGWTFLGTLALKSIQRIEFQGRGATDLELAAYFWYIAYVVVTENMRCVSGCKSHFIVPLLLRLLAINQKGYAS